MANNSTSTKINVAIQKLTLNTTNLVLFRKSFRSVKAPSFCIAELAARTSVYNCRATVTAAVSSQTSSLWSD